MDLLRLVMREYRLAFSAVMLASLANAALGIGVIAFINQRLIERGDATLAALPEFFGLILLLLVVALGAQLGLTTLGHYFVYHLRARLVRRIMETDIARLETIGSAALLASLSADVRNVTIAFVRLPELVQGVVLTLASVVYLGWLSMPILLLAAIWIAATMAVGAWLVRRVYAHLHEVRESEDALYDDYETIIHGRKELALNRQRAADIYERRFRGDALAYRHHIIRADTYHLSASNWTNIMMLGAIGLVFFLANGLAWASNATAATFALTLLFLRTPMISAVGALPTLLNAQVAFNKLAALELAPYRADFDTTPETVDWQRIALAEATFVYDADDDNGFAIGPIDFTLERGELVFIIGGNGSGKTTFARLLAGLSAPGGGRLMLDDTDVTADRARIRRLFSAVFTDFHLFDRLLGADGDRADDAFIDHWCQRLQLDGKLSREGATLLDTRLSQGQRKRVAMLTALAERRDILLLDEWAADQDPIFRRVFYHELLPAFRDMGHTVVAISHDDTYFAAADRLLEMRAGCLVELTGDARHAASQDAVARIS
ncbi:multidrug ABC transporter permease/ATP-binding protein [Salinisphaera sp. Q1T1-3]|uniref:multidrug ABC transporter permease/ATP-binding protein n=1 Tax=Salinisphaera sp. Q1T1-3 TaxID=2321229 RepID=UPI000E713BD2|nr:multidrug ABC transporter permease/ATP-binding protein [Salinisphaera sp. Q1T1-3]RJS93476.1 multidrug ABC transporter permease/ATP-binding protein [Salinisphaera sp. Q1T1-3]